MEKSDAEDQKSRTEVPLVEDDFDVVSAHASRARRHPSVGSFEGAAARKVRLPVYVILKNNV